MHACFWHTGKGGWSLQQIYSRRMTSFQTYLLHTPMSFLKTTYRWRECIFTFYFVSQITPPYNRNDTPIPRSLAWRMENQSKFHITIYIYCIHTCVCTYAHTHQGEHKIVNLVMLGPSIWCCLGWDCPGECAIWRFQLTSPAFAFFPMDVARVTLCFVLIWFDRNTFAPLNFFQNMGHLLKDVDQISC